VRATASITEEARRATTLTPFRKNAMAHKQCDFLLFFKRRHQRVPSGSGTLSTLADAPTRRARFARYKLHDGKNTVCSSERYHLPCENRNSNSDVRNMLTVRDSSSRLREVESSPRIYGVYSSRRRFTYSTGIPPVSRGFTCRGGSTFETGVHFQKKFHVRRAPSSGRAS